MLTVSKPLTPEAATSYYTRGNYYFESKGEWHGKFAEELGLIFSELKSLQIGLYYLCKEYIVYLE